MSNQLSGIFPRKLLSLFVSILFTLILTACTDESIYPEYRKTMPIMKRSWL